MSNFDLNGPLTFEDALKQPLAMEAADKDAKDLMNDLEPRPVQNVRSKYRPSTKQGPREIKGTATGVAESILQTHAISKKLSIMHATRKPKLLEYVRLILILTINRNRKEEIPQSKQKTKRNQTDHRKVIVVDVIVQNEKLKTKIDTVLLISETVCRKT